jgi:hypothetical protein
MGSKHDVGYEPSLGVNIISSSLIKSLVAASSLSRSSKLLNIPLGETLGCQGVLRVCPVKFTEHELYLDFHLSDLPCHHTHSIIIGRPIMTILEQSPRKPELELKIGDDFLPVSNLRSENTLVEAEPKPDLLEEIMAASLAELAQPNFEEEILFFTKEDEAPVSFELDPTEKPQWPPIELKPLPPGLKYAFLHGNRETPVIISDKLSEIETQQLITILETHRSVLGYSLQDLKGISPTLCTYRIPIEPNATPSREPQRRLNNNMREVVKKEVLKLLHVGIIYLVPNTEWVCPIQVVSKKGGMTVVRNDKNELIPQRTITRWRMCIDYRKLNKATKKDHFPLPFIDEMLERLAKHSFFCFLDGYSGYHQIPIQHDDHLYIPLWNLRLPANVLWAM